MPFHISCLPYRVCTTTQYSGWGGENRLAQAIFVAWYNFGRKNEALKGNTPAMGSELSDHMWSVKELIERAA